MTKEKRVEMIKYREKAVQIEASIRNKNNTNLQMKNALKSSPNQAVNFSEADSESTVDEYLKVSNLYRHPLAKKNRSNMQLDLSLEYLKNDTYDVSANTSTIALTDEDEMEKKRSSSSSSIISMISNITSAQNPNTISIPTIEINPPTPNVLNKELNEIAKSTKSTSKSPLIRSNSFTLESPSTVLLQHINRQQKTVQRKQSTATNDTIESKAKKVAPLKVSASNGNISSLRNKRSPYDSRSIKINRKKAGSLSKIRISSKGTVSSDPLKNVEETHRQKFIELLKKQKEEQKELQKHFEIQQQLLINELTEGMTAPKLVTESPVSEFESSPPFRKSYSDSSEPEKKTPRRKLFASSPDNNIVAKRKVSFQ